MGGASHNERNILTEVLAVFRRRIGFFERSRTEINGGRGMKARWELTVHIEEDELDGGWFGWVEELPGCASQGDTAEEAFENVTEAARAVIDMRMSEARESGLQLESPNTGNTVRLVAIA